eukprot:s3418_g5.t1
MSIQRQKLFTKGWAAVPSIFAIGRKDEENIETGKAVESSKLASTLETLLRFSRMAMRCLTFDVPACTKSCSRFPSSAGGAVAPRRGHMMPWLSARVT